jgi:hypothetical protein
MTESLHDIYLHIMSTSDRSRHIPALVCFRRAVAEKAGEVEAENAVERLLLEYHRREAERQFAESREEYSFTRAPDPSKPPASSLHPIGQLIVPGDLVTSYQILDEVAPSYRYRIGLRRKVQDDLLRWSTIFGGRVYHHVFDDRPVPAFEKLIVTSWLAAGGRAWIISELDHLGERRVVPFRGSAD